jgi:type VI secretion system protein ImpK
MATPSSAMTSMYSESFLQAQLRELYREVIRWKERIVRDPDAFRPAGVQVEETTAATVWQSLVALLERQAIAVRRSGGEYAAEVYREAQYLMAALADEVFLHLDWRGREDWQSNLLEQRLFGSHNAGDVVFQRIERILRTRDPLDGELAKVYLMALGLGFQGRWRGPGGVARIDELRRQLYAFVVNKDPDAAPEAKPLFPEAYASTLDAGEGRRLAYLRHWIVALLLFLVLWVVVADRIWRRHTGAIQTKVESFIEPRKQEASPSTR